MPFLITDGTLLKSINYPKDKGEAYRTLKHFVQEKNLLSSSIARLNMFLQGIDDFRVAG